MTVCSLPFLLSLLILSALFFWLPSVRLRQFVLAACNAGFIYSLIPNCSSAIALGAFVLSGYFVAKLLQSRPSRALLTAYIIVLLATFVVVKQYQFLYLMLPATLLGRTVEVVGLSYMLFRQIHVAVDAMQGQVEKLTLWSYLNYQLNLFGFLAGPIQRYQDFQDSWERLTPLHETQDDVLRAYRRVFVGVIKVGLLATLALSRYDRYADALAAGNSAEVNTHLKAASKFLGLLYLYPAYIYFNFSGYCDIVIGGASLLGLRSA